MKYLGVYLPKETKDLENYKSLMKDIKEYVFNNNFKQSLSIYVYILSYQY